MPRKNQRVPMGYEKLDPTAVVGITAALAGKGNLALIQCETANVRFRDDGSNPTATDGILLLAGANYYEYRGDLSAIRFLEVAINAVVHVSVYRETGE